jgi:hypothetical protein
MASTQKASFLPDGIVGGSFGFASSTIQLPGTPATDAMVRVTNLGPCHIAVALVNASSGSTSQSTGLVIPAGQTEFLTLSAGNTYLAGVAIGGPQNTSTVNIATGS